MPNTRTTYTTSINWKVRCEAVEAENDKLREKLAQCADDFEAAADGSGVNFYQCAVDLRAALTQEDKR